MEIQIGANQGKRRLDRSLKPCSHGDGLSRVKRRRTDDRLSLLPDEALNRILGMVPTKDAAATTVISHRFMPAFSLLKNFEFDDSRISNVRRSPRFVQRTPSFKKFVDYVLQASRSKQIDRFKLRFGRFCRDEKRYFPRLGKHNCEGQCNLPLEPGRLDSWLSFPLARSVRELDLYLHVQLSQDYRDLPRSIFVCETLETLKLDSNLDLDFGDVEAFPISLPRLKLLHLRGLIFTEDQFVTKLVNSCPVLEDLLLATLWECADVVVISSPSLLKLDVTINKCDRLKRCSSVTIHTPNVHSFKYWDNLAGHYSISDMNALVDAEITIVGSYGKDLQYFRLCSILKSCSTVSHLSLGASSVMCLDYDELKNHLPVFHNLNHLELGRNHYTFWGKVLLTLLECSPSLTTLVFPEGLTYYYTDDRESQKIKLERECWKRIQEIPSCCEFHLKKIVIKKYRGIGREHDMIQFLLGKALVLENLELSIARGGTLQTSAHLKLGLAVAQSVLLEIPRASKLCSITVL